MFLRITYAILTKYYCNSLKQHQADQHFLNIDAVYTFSELVTDLVNDVLPFDQPKTLKQVGYSLGVLSLPLPPVLQVPVDGVLVVLFWNRNKVLSSLNFVQIFV